LRDLANTEDLILEKRFRDIYEQISSMSETLDSLNTASDTVDSSDIIPALNNFLNNTDFIYADQDYNGSTYTDDDKVLAEWLVKAQSSSTAWSPNTVSTESAESITSSAHGTPSTGAVWATNSGSVTITGGYKIATKLPQKNAHAGAYLAVNMNISKPTGITLGDDLICKVSIWDNTDLRILRGSKPTLASTKNNSHTGGTVTRQYILEVLMPDGRTFYSDTSSFTTGQNQVINSVSAVTPDTTNTVSVSWSRILGASRYRIYRRTPSEADTNWYLVGTITNGTPLFVDTGGIGGGVWTVPSFSNNAKEFARAEAFLEDVETFINTATEEVDNISFGIRIPTNFSVNGNQYLVIEFLKSDYTDTTSTEIPTNGIRIDRVGLSYTNGRWTPSAKDMAVNAIISGNPNPPASSGGNGGNPASGGGISTCVEQTTPVLVWSDDGNHYYLPANSLVKGDRLVCWDTKHNCLAPTVIHKIIKGISKSGYYTYVGNKEVLTSFSHRYINDFDDFEKGTRITLDSNQVLCISDDYTKVSEMPITSIEQVEYTFYTRTFKLSNGKRNYIANGLFSHNAKPFNIVE